MEMIMNNILIKIIEQIENSKNNSFSMNRKDERKCWHLSCDNFYIQIDQFEPDLLSYRLTLHTNERYGKKLALILNQEELLMLEKIIKPYMDKSLARNGSDNRDYLYALFKDAESYDSEESLVKKQKIIQDGDYEHRFSFTMILKPENYRELFFDLSLYNLHISENIYDRRVPNYPTNKMHEMILTRNDIFQAFQVNPEEYLKNQQEKEFKHILNLGNIAENIEKNTLEEEKKIEETVKIKIKKFL